MPFSQVKHDPQPDGPPLYYAEVMTGAPASSGVQVVDDLANGKIDLPVVGEGEDINMNLIPKGAGQLLVKGVPLVTNNDVPPELFWARF